MAEGEFISPGDSEKRGPPGSVPWEFDFFYLFAVFFQAVGLMNDFSVPMELKFTGLSSVFSGFLNHHIRFF